MNDRHGDPFEPDPIDDVLGRGLRDAAPRADDTDDALVALAPLAARARRRHRIGRAVGVAAALTLVAGLGAVAVANDPDEPGVPFAGTTTTPSASPSTSTPTTVPATRGTTPGTGSTAATAPTAPPATAAAIERTFTSDGGSVWVRLDRGTLMLIAATPRPDYTAEVTDERADRIEVRFESDDGDRESRIRVRVENGELVEEIENPD